MNTGGGKVGMSIKCPDGNGVVTKVYDQDNVMIKLDSGILAVFDLEKCSEIKKAKEMSGLPAK